MGFLVHCGSEGQIWFVRVLPPPHPLCRHHVVFNTPYVIRDYPERAHVGDLMKYGPDPNHWTSAFTAAIRDIGMR